MAPKRKDASAAAGGAEAPKRTKKQPAAPAVADGWDVYVRHVSERNTAPEESLLYKHDDTSSSGKVAAFDFDGTLVMRKSGARFAVNAEDWRLFNDKVPQTLQDLHKDGYKLVIFTNQGAIKSQTGGKQATKVKSQINQFLERVAVPMSVYASPMKDKFRKPEIGMWDYMCEHHLGGAELDMGSCFFVGDASGREADHSDSDKAFAANIGITYKTPEEVFGDCAIGDCDASGESAGPNGELVNCFRTLAQLLAHDVFKANAFRKVATTLEGHDVKVTSGKEAQKLPGIGKASAKLIDEFLETGKMQAIHDLQHPASGPAVSTADKPKSMGLAFL